MASPTNGICAETINSNSNNDWETLKDLQILVPAMKQNFILISQQFSQFISYTASLERVTSAFEFMQRKQEELEKEIEQLKKDREDVDQQIEINNDNRVYLDVGGQRFTTTVKTLTQQNTSTFFKALINSNNRNLPDDPIFIDRDGRLFEYVLKYLRNGDLDVEDNTIRKDLLIEARYYKLQSLEDELSFVARKENSSMVGTGFDTTNQSSSQSTAPRINRGVFQSYSSTPLTDNVSQIPLTNQAMPAKLKAHPSQTALSWRSAKSIDTRLTIFPESTLLTNEYEEKLMEFMGLDVQRQPWRLIYRATEHGFDADDFHRCCDSFIPTISIIESDTRNIFGGFTRVPWSSASIRADQPDPTAFLFTLKNTLNIPPTKCPVAQEHQNCAISQNPTCGPNFGSPNNTGSDLCLRNKFNEKVNCIFFPKSYIDPTKQGGLIFAKKYFACREVEVFTLTNDI